MHPALPNPAVVTIFGDISIGSMYARCLLAVFAFQAIALAIYLIRRVRRQFHLLDEDTLLRRRAEAGEPIQDHQKKDVWTS